MDNTSINVISPHRTCEQFHYDFRNRKLIIVLELVYLFDIAQNFFVESSRVMYYLYMVPSSGKKMKVSRRKRLKVVGMNGTWHRSSIVNGLMVTLYKVCYMACINNNH